MLNTFGKKCVLHPKRCNTHFIGTQDRTCDTVLKQYIAERVPASHRCSHKTAWNAPKGPFFSTFSQGYNSFEHYFTPDFILA